MHKIMESAANHRIAARVATRFLKSGSSDRDLLRWAVGEVNDAIQKLDDVNRSLTARERGSGDEYDGYGSVADDDAQVARALHMMNQANRELDKVAAMLQARLSDRGRS